MIGTDAGAGRIPSFSDEERGKSLKDWMSDIWVKRDSYRWSDEQVARLIVECCNGHARAALEMLLSEERATLKSVLRCLEAEFYSDAKQTAMGLVFNTHIRHHGKTECEYATSLKQLALYAYKDASQYHIECRCREQFLAGLRSM